ncbi:MAG: 2-oxo acid dehydrogenase subunit E2 [Bacteroidales bacterium]|nr:2-oxo acid dehydrogenase subunit E2 [Bacteroidales bacterium]
MAEFKVIMPKLGESIQEATITKWFIKEGDKIVEDDLLLEVATDKVDSEIPSPVEGTVVKILYPESTLLPVGEVIALIRMTDDEEEDASGDVEGKSELAASGVEAHVADGGQGTEAFAVEETVTSGSLRELSNRFYSPLVRKIAEEEKVTLRELESIQGSGVGGRVQKRDLLAFLSGRTTAGAGSDRPQAGAEGAVLRREDAPASAVTASAATAATTPEKAAAVAPEAGDGAVQGAAKPKVSVSIGAEDQIIEMDRVRKLIADHMVMSKQVSPHVTSVVEADVTSLVLWRNKVKEQFQSRYGEKLTYMPAFIEATARALTEFPMVNASVDGNRIILRKHINIGIAVAKPDGNLIVPVIRNAEEKNLVGLTKSLNTLADAARKNKLSPDDIQGGSFSITNFGSFRNLIGTPIINQPQVAILATGSIEKKPAVLELPEGDVIAIRHKMFLSLSYDHRIVDGALGGAFLRRIADLLEAFDINRPV